MLNIAFGSVLIIACILLILLSMQIGIEITIGFFGGFILIVFTYKILCSRNASDCPEVPVSITRHFGTSGQRNMSTRNWVFTLNNPQEGESPELWKDKVMYCVWQLESGENGTHHFQGYLQLHKKSRISACKKLNSRAHWEPRRGSHEEAKTYCRKEESRVDGPWEYGEAVIQGERTDLKGFLHDAVNLPNEYELAMKYPDTWCKYYRAAERFRRIATKPRTSKTECWVLYGLPGAGKSSFCAENYPDAYWKPKGEWWDGYANQSVVIIDEFYGWLPFDFLCRLLDRYPLMVPTKGGFLTFSSRLVILTSNKHPREWYDPAKITWSALARRVDKCVFYSGVEPPVEESVDDAQPHYYPTSDSRPPGLVRSAAMLNALRLHPSSIPSTQVEEIDDSSDDEILCTPMQ